MEQPDFNPFIGIFPPQPWDLQSRPSQVSPEPTHETQTPPVLNVIDSLQSTPVETPVASSQRPRRRRHNQTVRPKLQLLNLEEWDENNTYDEDPPTCLHYTIVWSAIRGKEELVRDTEPDLVLRPSAYWQLILQRRVERLVQNRLGDDSTSKVDHVVAIVSLSGRSEPKLVKHFDTGIGWQCIEKRLTQWSDQFQSGKRLTVDLTLHYVEPNHQPSGSSSKRGVAQRRGCGVTSSATQRMRSRLSSQVNAEEESTGEAAKWPHFYSVMRCPDACSKGPHCLVDPITKKHTKMFPHHLEDLIHHKNLSVEKFQSQSDVPDDFRRQILAEEQQRRGTDHSKSFKSSSGLTPITINNHFPDRGSFSASAVTSGEAIGPDLTTEPSELPSPLDQAVRDYSEWQKSRVSDTAWKADMDNACDIVLAQRRDLRRIHVKRDVSFLLEKSVPIGAAERFVDDIPLWNKRRRRDS